jgi:hypothetical protein
VIRHGRDFVRLLHAIDCVDFNLYICEQDLDKLQTPRLVFTREGLDWNALGSIQSFSDLNSGDELKQLQSALVNQINQRAYFQDEYRRLQHKYVMLQEQLDGAVLGAKHLAAENERLCQIVRAHELTNMSLQEQLSQKNK